jgi:hypothetical protein
LDCYLMVKSKHMTVEEILNKVDNTQRLTVEKLRAIVKDTFPKVKELVRQERITYALNDKDFSGIRITKGHVDLLFLHGSSISSPLLKGQGTIGDPKHVEIYTLKNFDDAEARRLLKEEAEVVLTS